MDSIHKITYTIYDNTQQSAKLAVYVDNSWSFPGVIGFATEFAILLQPLILGKIININISYTVPIPGELFSYSVDPAADVEEGALFTFRTQDGHAMKIRIPSLQEVFLVPNDKFVFLEDEQIDAFISAMIDGLTVGIEPIQVCDHRGDDIVSLSVARERFNKDYKKRRPRWLNDPG